MQLARAQTISNFIIHKNYNLLKPPIVVRERATLHGVEDLRKCLSYSCKLLLTRALAVSPAFVSQIAYKNAIQFGNTSGEQELLLGTIEAESFVRLDCVVLLVPLPTLLALISYKCRLCVQVPVTRPLPALNTGNKRFC